MSIVYPPPAMTVDLTEQQRELLANHYLSVPSQGAIFAQVWPTHMRVAVFTPDEAKKIGDLLISINDARRASSDLSSGDVEKPK